METIKPYVRSTRRPGADAEIGGFGGVFDLKATGYRDPVLVSGTDGVGTKLRVAVDVGIHDLVGESYAINKSVERGFLLYFVRHRPCGHVRERSTCTGRRATVFPRLLWLRKTRRAHSRSGCKRDSRWLPASRLCLDWRRDC